MLACIVPVLMLVMLACIVPVLSFLFLIWIFHVGLDSHANGLLESQLVLGNIDTSRVLDIRLKRIGHGVIFCNYRPETAAWSLGLNLLMCFFLFLCLFLCLLSCIFCRFLGRRSHCAQTIVMLWWRHIRLLRNRCECCIKFSIHRIWCIECPPLLRRQIVMFF